MAAKVNVKFIVILSVVLLLLAGGVGVLGAMVLFKSAEDNVHRGDEYLAQGNYIEAAKSYGKAVNKENYNPVYLRKWADAAHRATPSTDVEYRSMYRDQYLAALRQLAVVERADPQTQDDFLAATFRQLKLSAASAESWGQFNEAVTNAIDGLDMTQPEAQRLLRYRGLASVFRFRTLDTVDQVERTRADDDLLKALAADPNDVEAALGRVELMSAEAMAKFRAGRAQESNARWGDAMNAIAALVKQFPTSPRVLLRSALMIAERTAQTATTPDQQKAVSEALRADIIRSIEAARTAPIEAIDEQFLAQLSRAVSIAGTKGLAEEWLKLLDNLAEKAPDNAALLLERGKAYAALGRSEEAIARFDEIANKADLPVSIEGLILREVRVEARRLQIESALNLWSTASAEDKPAAMERVKRYREALASRVGADNPALLRSDAQIAFAERRLDDAVNALTQLRKVTGSDDSEILTMLGRALAAQQKLGAAAEQFRRIYEREPNNLSALLALIQLELQSGNRDVVSDLLTEAEKLAPDNEIVKNTRRLLAVQQTDLVDPNDPVLTILNSSLTLRTQNPPDYPQAIALIDQQMTRFPDDPRLPMERLTLENQTKGRESALALAKQYTERYPNNARLHQMEVMLQYDDPITAQEVLIDQSELSDLQKRLSKTTLYYQSGRSEQGDAELAKAKALAPDDLLVLELEFARAMEKQDYTDGQRLAQRAAQLNADGVGGQLYQARLELAQGKSEAAAATLDRVTREDEYNVPAWRFLGSAQLAAGRVDEALRAFDRALKIKPDDMPTVLAYIGALSSVGRTSDALALARKASNLPAADNSIRAARLELEETQVGDARYAIDQRMRLHTADPGNRANNLALAQLLIRENRLDDAESLINSFRIQNGQPDLALALVQARLLAARGKVDDATARIHKEIDALPAERRGEGYVVLADFLFERQRPDDALQALQQARNSQGPLMPVDRKLGDYYFNIGDFTNAIASYRSVVDAGADRDSIVAKRLAESYLRVAQLDDAERVITAIESKSSADSQTLLLRAQIALDRQNPLESRRLLDQAIKDNPNNALAFLRRAQLGFTDESQFAAVLQDLRQAAQLQPDNITVRQLLSQLFVRRNRVNEAIDELAQAVRARPENDALRYEYIRLLGEHGSKDQMLAAIQQAVNERGQEAPQWFTLAGDALASTGDTARALTLYERANEVSPNPQTLARLTQAYLDTNPPRTQQATQALNAFVAATPEQQFVVALLRGRVEAAAGNSRAALQLFAQTWQQSGDSPPKTRLWFEQARAAFGANQTDFLAFINQLPTQTSDGMTPTAVVAVAMIKAGDPAQSTSTLQSLVGIEDRTDDPGTLLALARVRGQLAYIQGDYPGAVEAYRLGLTVAPNDSELNNNLAYTLAKYLKEPQNALAYATKASEAAPLDANVLDTLGLIYLLLDRNTQAEATFQRALDSARNDIERVPVLVHIAQVKKRAGDTVAAVNSARQAIQLGESTHGAPELYQSELNEARAIASGQ